MTRADYSDCACHVPHPYKRIQLRRTKGWRKPVGTIVVARPSRWGNPWRVEGEIGFDPDNNDYWFPGGHADAIAWAVTMHREWISDPGNQDGLPSLAGHDLACWCPLPETGQPDMCHAAVLLEIANGWQA